MSDMRVYYVQECSTVLSRGNRVPKGAETRLKFEKGKKSFII